MANNPRPFLLAHGRQFPVRAMDGVKNPDLEVDRKIADCVVFVEYGFHVLSPYVVDVDIAVASVEGIPDDAGAVVEGVAVAVAGAEGFAVAVAEAVAVAVGVAVAVRCWLVLR